jgi:outer membrane protein TolC
MRTSPIAGLVLVPLFLVAAGTASAQPQPKPRPQPPAAVAAPPAAPPAPTELPKVEVTDPLLAPIPAAPHLLGSFHDALTTIAARSTDLAIAEQEIERAEGASRQALAGALPSVNGQASISQNLLSPNPITVGGQTITPANGPTASISLSASQPILAPRAWYGIKTAKLNVKVAQQGTDDKRRTLLAQLASSIVSVYTAERLAEINRVALRSALQRLNLAERKSRLGDGTRLDVLRAQQDAALSRGQLIAGDEALRKTREALGLALGSNEPWSVPPTISLDEMQSSMSSSCTPGSVEDRPDVVAARTSVEIANRGITDSKLAFSPTAAFQTSASASTGSGNGLSSGNQTSWTISAVLNVPFWEGGARYGAMRIARANAEQAKLRLDATQRGATIEANQAVRSVGVAEQARVVSEQNRDLAREAARLAERAFAAGAGTSFDLVDAGKNERNAELDLAVKEFEVIKSRIAALLATANCRY